MRNLHRLTGARYEHEKIGLCQRCALRKDFTDRSGVEWAGVCTAKNKILCCPSNARQPRCTEFVEK